MSEGNAKGSRSRKAPAPLPSKVEDVEYQFTRKREDGTFTLPVPHFTHENPEELDKWLPHWGFGSRDEALCYFVNEQIDKSAVAGEREDIKKAKAKGENALSELLRKVAERTRVSFWNGPRSTDGLTAAEKKELGTGVAAAMKDPEKAKVLKELGII